MTFIIHVWYFLDSLNLRTATTMCGGEKFSEFQVDCLDAHNDYRSRHGVPPLDLNKGLCKYAEDHAKFLAQCGIEKPSKGSYGENIFIKCSQRKVYADAYEPVMKWYSEVKKYEEDNTDYPSKDIKHFVQVVWKETKSLGIGYAIDR